MNLPSRTTFGTFVLTATIAACLVACGGEKPEALMASAKGYIAKNDSRAAIIQLKNVLQTEPNRPEARFLLGQALLQAGDVIGAEVELRKALALQVPHDQVDPLLARDLLLQGQTRKLVDEFATSTQTTPQSIASVQTSLADAYGALGRLPDADAAIARALAAAPNDPLAGVAAARLQGSHGDVNAALATLAQVVSRAPDAPESAEAYKLRGDILQFSKGRNDEAMTAYRKAVALQPALVLGHAAIIELQLRQDDLAGATAQLDVLKKLGTGRAQERYLEARLAYQKKDFKLARELVQGLLKAFPDSPLALQLAAAIELDAYSPSQAAAYANHAVEVDPSLTIARRTAIAAYLRNGQTDRATSALLATIDPTGQIPPDMWDIAGQVYLETRDLTKAEHYFAMAAETRPNDFASKTSLAVTRLARGGGDTALQQLQAVAAGDKGTSADFALISAYMGRGDFDKALGAVDKLEAKRPGSAQAQNLRGRIEFLRQDLPAARANFDKAAAIDPALYAPVAALVAMDMSAHQPDAAKKRLDDFVARNPGHVLAATLRAEIAIATFAPSAEVVDRLGRIISANPGEAAPRLLLVTYQLQQGDVKNASSSADDAVAALPQEPGLLEAQGRAQAASGELIRARDTFAKMASLQPQSPVPQLRIAETYFAARDPASAKDSLLRSLRVQPAYLPAQFALVAMAVADKKFDDALAIARTVQKQRPAESAGFVMEGDIDIERARLDAAADAYRAGLKVGPASSVVLKLHGTLLRSGKTAEADALARDWIRTHPDDALVQSNLGDLALGRRDYAAAEEQYRSVVAKQPDNATVLNNLAWVVYRQGKPGALAFAETANRLRPKQPSFLDTLAVLVADTQDYKRALALENEALALAPDSPDLKLNRARILLKSGDKSAARADLDALARLGDKFKDQGEVASLLKQV